MTRNFLIWTWGWCWGRGTALEASRSDSRPTQGSPGAPGVQLGALEVTGL